MYQRDTMYYTQGLLKWGDRYLESSGLYGKSYLHYLTLNNDTKKVDISNKSFKLDNIYFGEGCEIVVSKSGDVKIYQMTWTKRMLFVYDEDLNRLQEMSLPQPIETGWGITHDPKVPNILYITDGTSTLYTLDIDQNFKLVGEQTIKLKGNPKRMINELEFIDGYIWANIYLTTYIVKIDPKTAEIVKQIDFSELVYYADDIRHELKMNRLEHHECLNGIAYDKEKRLFTITGKNWPMIFVVEMADH